MRGVFDGQDVRQVRATRDTELTLGAGSLLAILIGLLLLCGLCFGFGYTMGHHSATPTTAAAPQPATDQEPLQANGAVPKPSAIAATPVAPPPDTTAPADQASGTASNAAAGAQVVVAPVQPSIAAAQPEVRPALPVASAPSVAQPQKTVTAQTTVQAAIAPPAGQTFAVQVAAVSNAEDANVLSDALKKRNYPVTSHREAGDNLIHVRVGPFTSRGLADQWRLKLLNDGYNAQVQP